LAPSDQPAVTMRLRGARAQPVPEEAQVGAVAVVVAARGAVGLGTGAAQLQDHAAQALRDQAARGGAQVLGLEAAGQSVHQHGDRPAVVLFAAPAEVDEIAVRQLQPFDAQTQRRQRPQQRSAQGLRVRVAQQRMGAEIAVDDPAMGRGGWCVGAHRGAW
jgi:hypothetical protein